MIIDRITLHHLRMPLVAPFETSFGRITDRECILIEVASDGLTGWGECVADRDPGYAYETAGTAWHILRDFLVPAVLGQDVAEPADFQARGTRTRPSDGKSRLGVGDLGYLGKTKRQITI